MAEREASSPAAHVDEERRLPSGGHRRYFGSVELGGVAGQVNTNDVVEIANQPGRQQQRAVAQVRSESTFGGAEKAEKQPTCGDCSVTSRLVWGPGGFCKQ